MANDFGVRTRPGRYPLGVLAVVGFVLLSGLIFWATRMKHEPEAIATAKTFAFSGPPCPALTEQAFRARGVTLGNDFEHGGVWFSRQFGHASCDNVATHGGKGLTTYAVCQFTSPQTLKVTTGKGVWYFAPGTGQPVAVSLEGGTPHCMMIRDQRLR